MNKAELIRDIEAHLAKVDVEAAAEERLQQELEAEKREYVGALVDFFNVPAVRTLLEKTGAEISIFRYADYELAVCGEGLLIRRDGGIDGKILVPAAIENWSNEIPYGGIFPIHDSDEDYEWKPKIEETMQDIEKQLRSLIKG